MRKPMGRKAAKPGVYAVTGVRSSLTEDVNGRQRRYALAMSIRTVCFLLCVVTPGPLRWAFFVGALVLPYVAVVIANGGRETEDLARSRSISPHASSCCRCDRKISRANPEGPRTPLQDPCNTRVTPQDHQGPQERDAGRLPPWLPGIAFLCARSRFSALAVGPSGALVRPTPITGRRRGPGSRVRCRQRARGGAR
jgi:hypothetical protein